ncbi:uncharacterized protein [Epargyreus clarus]|uniref:uncharacterized protein n=1 Tax=Epargyreus clarus TaxID=520877 RepID=UPI003C2CBDB4
MYEYNCDFERDFDMVNYSDCYQPASGCPTVQPCPSHPPCPNHAFHRMGQKFRSPARRVNTRRPKTTPSLPMIMLKGKRRYTPKPLRRRHTTKNPTIKKTISNTMPTTVQTVIIRKETIVKNGRKFIKVIRGIVRRQSNLLKGFDADDFLEK